MRKKFFTFALILFVVFLFWIVWIEFIGLKIWEVKELKIEGNEIIPTKILKEKLERFVGQSIFKIRNNSVKEKVKEISQLKDIRIKREFPDQILIRIVERKPFANLFCDKKYFIIDDEGYILNKPGMLIANVENLPVVKKIKEGDIISKIFLKRNYINVINKIVYELRGIVSAKDLQIDLNDIEDIIVYLGESVKVKLGNSSQLKEKLKKLNYFISLKNVDINKLDYIDVRFSDNIVVKYNTAVQKQEKNNEENN